MKRLLLSTIIYTTISLFIHINSYAQTQTSRNVVSTGVFTGGSIQAGSAFLNDNALYSNGANAQQVGLGSLCCDAINTPTLVSRGIKDFGLTAEGGFYITQSGQLFGFGSNMNNRFNGEHLNTPTLLEIGILEAAMSSGNYIFLKKDSTAWVNGASTSSSRAKQIATGVRSIAGTQKEKSSHEWYMYYLTDSDSLFGFSNTDNNMGNFGLTQSNNTYDASYPVYIAENIQEYSVYSSQLVYITNDGKLLGLGDNELKQLGSGEKDPAFTGNRISNGDFSNGIIDPAWSLISRSGATITNEVVSEELKVSINAPQSSSADALVKLRLNKASIRYNNNGYTFSVKLRSESNNDIRIKIAIGDASWRDQSVQINSTDQTVEIYFETWTDVNRWFDDELYVQFEVGLLNSPLYIDDVSIVPSFSYDDSDKVFEPTLIDNDVVSVRTGHQLTMYQKSNGDFYVVGTDDVGMITGTKGTFETPTLVNFPDSIDPSEIIDYEVGYDFLVIALSDGSFYGIGNNSGGRIGLGRLIRTTKEWTKIKVPTYAGPTWYVDAENGDDETGNGSDESPYATIQAAVDKTVSYSGGEYDTVFVLPGTYEEKVSLYKKVIKLISTEGPLSTTLANRNDVSIRTDGYTDNEYGCGLEINGFTITAIDSYAAVSVARSCPTFRNVIITIPNATAFDAYQSAPKFENALIYNSNRGLNIAQMDQSGNFDDYNVTLKHVAIINNSEYGINNDESEIVQLVNSIVYNNGRGNWQFDEADVLYYQIRGDYEVTTSVVEGDDESLNVNPLFKSDYTLSDFSALIGAGTETTVLTDLLGNPRPNPEGTNPDIGPYENALGEVPAIPQPDTVNVSKTETSVTLTWKFSDANKASLNSILDKYVVFKAVGNIADDLVAIDTVVSPRSRYSDTDVEIGTPYMYAIQTITDDGRKSSIEVTRTVLVENLPPDAPELTANINNTSVELIWESDDESIVGFELFKSTDRTQLSLYEEIDADSSSFLDEGLIKGQTYYYAIRALDDRDDYSAFSDTLEIIPGSQLNQAAYLRSLSTTTNYRNTDEYDHYTMFIVDGALYGTGKNNSQAFGFQCCDNLYYDPERLDRSIIHIVATPTASIRINSKNELYAAGQMWSTLDNHYDKATLFKSGVTNADLSNSNLAYIDEDGKGYLTGSFQGRDAETNRASYLFADNVVDIELTNTKPNQWMQQNLYYLTKNGRLYGAGYNGSGFIEPQYENYLENSAPQKGTDSEQWQLIGTLADKATKTIRDDTFIVSYESGTGNRFEVTLQYTLSEDEILKIEENRNYNLRFSAKADVSMIMNIEFTNSDNTWYNYQEVNLNTTVKDFSFDFGNYSGHSLEGFKIRFGMGGRVSGATVELSNVQITDAYNGTVVPIDGAGLIATNVKAMAAEYDHLLYVTQGDSLFVVGDNEFGQLGDITELGETVETPTFIAKNVRDVKTSERYSHIITNQGLLFSTGDFSEDWAPYTFERIEDARIDSAASDSTNNSIYVIEAPGAVYMADSVAESVPGLHYALYKKSDGNIFGIGKNLYGQLGIGSDAAYADKWTPINGSRYVGPIWYVDAKLGDNSGEGSIASPFKSIAMGVNVAAKGDTVMVMPGIYTERIEISGEEIVIMSTDGFENTIVRPTEWASFQMWNVGSKNIVIDGFTITNREEWCSNTGINMWQSGLTLKNSKLVNLWEPLKMDRSVVTVENTIFTNNCNYPIWIKGINSQQVFTERKNILNHVTIVNNQNGIFLEEGYDVEITNSIIHSNGDYNNADFTNLSVQLSGEFVVKNSIVENWTEGENVYDFDPILRGDYSLPDFSMAIGKGARINVAKDINGNVRPSGIVEPIFYPDLGAHENPLHEPTNYPAPNSIKIIDREFYVDVEFQIDTVLVDYVHYFLIYRGVDAEEITLIDTLFADRNQTSGFAKISDGRSIIRGKAVLNPPLLVYPYNDMQEVPATEYLEWEPVENASGYDVYLKLNSGEEGTWGMFEGTMVQPFGGYDENGNPIGLLGFEPNPGTEVLWAVKAVGISEDTMVVPGGSTLESEWSELWKYTISNDPSNNSGGHSDQSNKFTYSDLTAEIGIKYFYQIQMVGFDGRQGDKPEELPSVTIQNLPPKALRIQETSTFNGRATFGWAEPEDRDLAEFQIYRGTNSDNLERLARVSADERQFRNTNLQNGKTYYFAVTGIDKFGLEGPFSNVVELTPQNIPPIVTDGSVRNLFERGVEGQSIKVTLNASNYVIDADGSIERIEWFDDGELAASYGNNSFTNGVEIEVEQGTNRIRMIATDNDSAKTTIEFNVNVSGAFRQLDQSLSDNSGITLIGTDYFFVPVVGGELKILNSQFNDRGLSVSVSGEIKSESSISSDTVMYIASTNRDINVFSKRGAPLWATPLGGDLFATPTIDPIRNLVYVGVSNGNLFALNRANGDVVWTFLLDSPVNDPPVVFKENYLIVFTITGMGYFFDLDGSIRDDELRPIAQVGTQSGIKSAPAVDKDGFVYVAQDGGQVAKVYLNTENPGQSQVIWQNQYASSFQTTPVIGYDGTIFVGGLDSTIYAIDHTDGFTKWRFKTDGAITTTATINQFGSIYFGDETGKIYAVDEFGNEIYTYSYSSDQDGEAVVSIGNATAYIDGNFVFATADGTLNKINDLWRYEAQAKLVNAVIEDKTPQWGTYQGNFRRSGNQADQMVTSNEVIDGLPTEFELRQNYPNPFNPSTTIIFALPQASQVKIEVFNLIGQRVATLANSIMKAGYHQLQFDASALSSGTYFYKLTAGDFKQTKSMVLIK